MFVYETSENTEWCEIHVKWKTNSFVIRHVSMYLKCLNPIMIYMLLVKTIWIDINQKYTIQETIMQVHSSLFARINVGNGWLNWSCWLIGVINLQEIVLCHWSLQWHHMTIKTFEITSDSTVCWEIYWNWHHRKHHSSPSLGLCEEIQWWQEGLPQKGPYYNTLLWCHHVL